MVTYNPGNNDCRVLTLLKPIMSVTYLKAVTRQNAYQYQRRKLRPLKWQSGVIVYAYLHQYKHPTSAGSARGEWGI